MEIASAAENANCGAVSVVGPSGPEITAGAGGGVVSTTNERDAGVASGLPRRSVARTSRVCSPSASAGVVNGELHAANVPPSSRHSNVLALSALNVNVGVASLVTPSGPESIVVLGAPVSIRKACVSGVGSTLPAASVARTENVCAPSARVPVVSGEVQAANVPPSTRHWNVACLARRRT